ncbi:MAG TPA: AmmeMemoRadiSam system protein A [Terriglobia bacterium]|jgi:AmmeMemoRadiSam system protein A|nr:AmmeMemoRadiSam system protein A [Terriglobia bacterium]
MSPLTDEERQKLLTLARQALEAGVLRHGGPDLEGYFGALAENGGAFVTLRLHGELRGCIGQVESDEALARNVARSAASAALHDPRFPSVTPAELPDISIEISVLSPLADIAPEAIEIGRHGLLISEGLRHGLLLPQVPAQWGWDREQFLEQTCLKAGLPADAWRRGARVQAFTTLVIAEPDQVAALHSAEAHSSTPR